jgi:hypothetical protein
MIRRNMSNRRRKLNEDFEAYRASEKEEAIYTETRLKGRWFYKCAMYLDQWGRRIPYKKGRYE